MKSSKLIDQLNNRLFITLPLLLISGLAAFLILLSNLAFIIKHNIDYYINQLIGGYIMPMYMALSIPIFIIILIYYIKLSNTLERVEERS